jgi:hypothetical protein
MNVFVISYDHQVLIKTQLKLCNNKTWWSVCVYDAVAGLHSVCTKRITIIELSFVNSSCICFPRTENMVICLQGHIVVSNITQQSMHLKGNRFRLELMTRSLKMSIKSVDECLVRTVKFKTRTNQWFMLNVSIMGFKRSYIKTTG